MAVSARGGDETPEIAPTSTHDNDAPGKHAREKKKVHPFWRGLREIVVIVVVALVLSALIRAFLLQAFYVPSASMEDTLRPGDRIVASKITTDISGVKRGEIVVFRIPAIGFRHRYRRRTPGRPECVKGLRSSGCYPVIRATILSSG